MEDTQTSATGGLWPALGARCHLLAAITLGAVVLLTYANSFRTGFALDNKFLILDDPRLRAATRENVHRILVEDYWWPKAVSGLYRPVTTMSYLLNYAVLGNKDHPAGYHAINLLLHAGNTVLVYFTALLLMQRLWPAFFTAALFGAHPIATESVTNIIGRADLFAALTVLGGFLLYVRSTTEVGARKRPWLLGLMTVTTVGVFCKESALVLLGIMALYDLVYRVECVRPNRLANLLANFWRFAVTGYIAVLPPILAAWCVRWRLYEGMRPPELPFVDNPLKYTGDVSLLTWFFQSRLTAIKIVGKYLWLLIWPQTLSCDYSYNQIPLVGWPSGDWEEWKTVIALVAVAALVVAAVRSYRSNRAVFFFGGFFFVTFLPTSNLLKIIGSIMAERFMYLPSVGFAACVVLAVYAVCRRLVTKPDLTACCVLSAMVVACGARAFARNVDWTDDVHLWIKAVEACPHSFKTHKSLAYAWYEKDPGGLGIDRIIAESEKAMAIMNERALADVNKTSIVPLHLGVYYRIKGDTLSEHLPDGNIVTTETSRIWYEKSVDVLRRAVPLDQAYNEDTHQKELRRGKTPEQIIDVGNDEIYYNLGLAYMRLGQYENAVDAYRYVRRLIPASPDPYVCIGSAYVALGKADLAAVALSQALILDNNRKDALQVLVEIYRQSDRDHCAIRGTPESPQLNADCPLVRTHLCSAYYGLIQTFLDTKRFAQARQTKQTVLQSNLCQPQPFDQLLPDPSSTGTAARTKD